MPKTNKRWVALLRGINVGDNNLIPMKDLRTCLESIGLIDVQTYIQSGNVIFSTGNIRRERLADKLGQALLRRFDYGGCVTLLSVDEYRAELSHAHSGWGDDPNAKHNALFLVEEISMAAIREDLPEPTPWEQVSCGDRGIFWSADRQAISRTAMMKVAKMPMLSPIDGAQCEDDAPHVGDGLSRLTRRQCHGRDARQRRGAPKPVV